MSKPRANEIEPRLQEMALGIARAYMRRLPRFVCRDDIEQAALIGLIDGLRKHPERDGDNFDHYLRMRIRGQIADELRAQDWNSRRGRGSATPVKVMHLDDVHEGWAELLPGVHADAEETAIAKLDGAKAWRAPMKQRDQRMLRGRFAQGRLQRELAAAEGISEARVCQRLTRVLAGIRLHLTGSPPLANCLERVR